MRELSQRCGGNKRHEEMKRADKSRERAQHVLERFEFCELLLREHAVQIRGTCNHDGITMFGGQKVEAYTPAPPPLLPNLPSTCSCGTDDDKCESARGDVSASCSVSQRE